MDELKLSYDDVVNKIPYRNLVWMMKDKLKVAYGDVNYEVSTAEFKRLKGMA